MFPHVLIVLAIGFLLATASYLYQAVQLGRVVTQTYRNNRWGVESAHRARTTGVLISSLAALGVILMLRQVNPKHPDPVLLCVHLTFAFTFFLVFLAMKFWFTGNRTKYHRFLAYICISTFTVALATGFWMFVTIW